MPSPYEEQEINDLHAFMREEASVSELCVTCGKDSERYADIGREGYECESCYERGIEN